MMTLHLTQVSPLPPLSAFRIWSVGARGLTWFGKKRLKSYNVRFQALSLIWTS